VDRDRSDAEIILSSIDDPSRFSAIFDRHVTELARYIARRVDGADVEDVVAEVFLEAFRSRRAYDVTRARSLPWLYGIAINVVRHHFRDEARRRRLQDQVWRSTTSLEAGTSDADTRMEAERVIASLDELESDQREALLLFAWADLTYEEIAVALRIPVGTVRSRISRSRGRLRELLGHSEATTYEGVRHGSQGSQPGG
jgi:RNA polymerase sigma-70 factor (ECF subfamily)